MKFPFSIHTHLCKIQCYRVYCVCVCAQANSYCGRFMTMSTCNECSTISTIIAKCPFWVLNFSYVLLLSLIALWTVYTALPLCVQPMAHFENVIFVSASTFATVVISCRMLIRMHARSMHATHNQMQKKMNFFHCSVEH